MQRRHFTVLGIALAAFVLAGARPVNAQDGESESPSEKTATADADPADAPEPKSELEPELESEPESEPEPIDQDAPAKPAGPAASGLVAGWDKSPFIGSVDGNHLLRIGARFQFRYAANLANGAGEPGAKEDESEAGFELRRARLKLYGHAYSPQITYQMEAEFNRNGGDLEIKQGWLAYDLDDRHTVKVGLFKSNFLHEEQVSDGRQLTAERSNVNEFFTLDYSEGLEISGEYLDLRWWAALHDGRENENTSFNGDTTEFAVNGRVELLRGGKWMQFKDFSAWSTDGYGVMIGFGLDYEQGEGGEGSAVNWKNMLNVTADVSLESYPLNFFGSVMMRQVQHDSGAAGTAGDDEYTQTAFLVQAGLFLKKDTWDVFGRLEMIDFDGAGELTGRSNVAPLGPLGVTVDDNQSIFTFGTNYYYQKHKAKMTLDVFYAPKGIRQGELGANNRTSNLNDDQQIGLRAQWQLQF
jgi:hypothetical protein